MQWLSDPAHIVMILTVLSTMISEALPFLPSRAQGIVHGILSLFQAGKQYEASKVAEKQNAIVIPLKESK